MSEKKNINMIPGATLQMMHVSQNDIGRTFAVELFEGTTPFEIPSGAVVTIEGCKPSSLGFKEAGVISSNTAGNRNIVTFTTTKTMTDEYGEILTECKVTNGTTKLGTANFILSVEKDPHPEHTTDGSLEELIPTITLLMETAEAYAVGTRSGVPVSEDDPAYQNNAKFYADVLGQAAANAGYMFMDIVDGDLIYTRTDNTQVDFELNDGDLYATIDE